jgi:hypothetical protein
MTVVIKKNATKEEVKKILAAFSFPKKRKSFSNFLGKPIVDLQNLDPVSYQKMLRNERD